MSRRYLLITPCRDEAEFLQTTIDSVARQSVRPKLWIVVDDGSKDETPAILDAAAREYPFLRVVTRADRGARAVGPGVIEAFYSGLEHADLAEFDYVCKLDGDLEIPPRYFERLMERFEADPYLGTSSGKLYLRYGDRLVHERCGDENSVGPSKFYRVACFQHIGGFVREVSWDGIDGHLCRMHGWVAESVDEPELRLVHLRRMGSSQRGFWTGRLRWGRGKYYMGSAWYYVAAVSLYRVFERPFILSGVGIFFGYIQAVLRGLPRYQNPAYRRFLRRYERRALLRGKRATTARYNRHIREGADVQRPGAARDYPASP